MIPVGADAGSFIARTPPFQEFCNRIDQEADIPVLAIDPHFQGYGNPWFSVQAVACTEIISFPYTPLRP